MSPNLRRAAHQALDLILDALAEEQRAKPVKTSRVRGAAAAPSATMPADVTPEEVAAAERTWGRNGYRKAG